MKRLFVFLLSLLAVFTAACAGKTAADQSAAGQSAQTDPAYNTDTDYDNRRSGLQQSAVIETEDAYYIWHVDDYYIRYYDKVTADSGCLCPRPECVHDEMIRNPDCAAYVPCGASSLTLYQGQLWWKQDVSPGRVGGIYRMDPDGTNKELVFRFDYTDELMGRCFIHRGRAYFCSTKQTISQGMAFNTFYVGYIDLESREYHLLAARKSFAPAVPSLRFVGDSVYIFFATDGLGEGEADFPPDYYTDPEVYRAWWEANRITDEVLRWDPSMEEPECVYINSAENTIVADTRFYDVAADGTIYAVNAVLQNPDEPWDAETNQYRHVVYRLDPDGTRTEILRLDDGTNRFFTVMTISDGLIAAYFCPDIKAKDPEIDLWLLTYDGETLYKGGLPMKHRESLPSDKHELVYISDCIADRNGVVISFREYYPTSEVRPNVYTFVRYDMTPDGLKETLLGSGEGRIGVG